MSDPRIDPNYRGVKCKGCGEYLPFLFNRLCTHCALEAKDAEIERLQEQTQTRDRNYNELWHQYCDRGKEIERLQAMIVDYEYIGELEREVQHLRAALEQIERTILGTPDQFKAIAREALREVSDE